jgi:hypothetical protein
MEFVKEFVGLVLQPGAEGVGFFVRDRIKVQHELVDQIR